MRTRFLGGALFALLVLASCEDRKEPVLQEEPIKSISFTISAFHEDGDEVTPLSKTALAEGNAILWSDQDTVGIYPNVGAQVYFEITGGTGSSTASFDGGGWALKGSSVYYAYYPFIGDIYLDRNKIPVSYLSQKQIGTTVYDHIGPFDFMYAAGTSAENGALNFAFTHLNCIIRFVVSGLPAGSYQRLTLTAPTACFVKEGYYDLTSASPAIVATEYTDNMVIDLEGITLEEEGSFTVYMMCAPVNLNGVTVQVGLLDSST